MILDLKNLYSPNLSIRVSNEIYKININLIKVTLVNNRLDKLPILIELL